MPDDKYKEVLIVLVACIALFIILASIILLFLFLYMRRKYLQRKQVADMELQFKETTLRAQLEIQEQTFQAISQEIHDNVGQLLSLAKVQVNIMAEKRAVDEDLIHDIRNNIGQAMTDLRDLSHSMNSDRIRSGLIHNILRQEAERINRSGVLRAGVSVEGEAKDLEAQKKLILFRIIQESIQNCIKHAKASAIDVRFSYHTEKLLVSIHDDGKGFDPADALISGHGQGLENIRTRIRLAGGVHYIQSLPGKGTHITLTIPYE